MNFKGALTALYYPYATPRNIERMKKALLVFDYIYFIYPVEEQEDHNYVGINREGESQEWRPYDFSRYGSLELGLRKGVFRIIRPKDTAIRYSDCIANALQEDQKDKVFLKLKNRGDWIIYVEKVPPSMELRALARMNIRRYGKETIRVPFHLGESIMLSHAAYACHSKQKEGEIISPITDENLHRVMLAHRLNRGVNDLKSIQSDYDMPRINNAIDMYIPEPSESVEEIIEIRKTHEKPLSKLRVYIKMLGDVMQHPDDDDYDRKIVEIKNEIISVYDELELANVPANVVKSYKYTTSNTSFRPEVLGTNQKMVFGGLSLGRIPNIAHALISRGGTPLSKIVSEELTDLPRTGTDLELIV